MRNVKSYKDGNRLILVVENCTGETAKIVNSFLAQLLVGEAEEVQNVAPPMVAEDTPPAIKESQKITAGAFTEDISEEEAGKLVFFQRPVQYWLNANHIPAIICIATEARKNLSAYQYRTVIALCSRFLHNDLYRRNPSDASEEEIKDFFDSYKDLLKPLHSFLLKKAGCSDFDVLWKETNLSVKQDAYRCALDELRAKFV